MKYNYHWDWSGSEDAFKQAISINPNYPEARRWYSHLLLILNRFEESHQQMDMGIELKPTSPIMHFGKSSIQVRQSDFKAAIKTGVRMVSMDSEFVAGLDVQAQGEFGLGNFEDSLKLANEGLEKFNNQKRYLRSKLKALYALGRTDDVKRMRDELFSRAESDLVPAMTLAFCGVLFRKCGGCDSTIGASFEREGHPVIPARPEKRF